MTQLHRRLTMDKFIGFDIDHKHTLACVVQAEPAEIQRKALISH